MQRLIRCRVVVPFRVKDMVLAEGSCVSLRVSLYRRLRGLDFVGRAFQPRPWGLLFVDEPECGEDESGEVFLYVGNVCVPEDRTPLLNYSAWDDTLTERQPPAPPPPCSTCGDDQPAPSQQRVEWDAHVSSTQREYDLVVQQLDNCTPASCRSRVSRLRAQKLRLEKELSRIASVV